ncbi:MAG: hypothetical protein Q8R44_09185 [Novosphingobium sp.]|nr:hypothetical protein [Novosphingobium sp.]
MTATVISIANARRARRAADLEHLRELAARERSQRLARLLGDDWDGPTPPRAA